nr:GspH/FimT family pseudopilin [uncultured Rhodopila sp.]
MTARCRYGTNGYLRTSSPPPGFTLIEILVVLAILGLALSIVAGFAPMGRSALDLAAATDTLTNTLRLARVQAITRQQPVLFTLPAGGQGYAVDGTARALPNDVNASMDRAAIRFTPDGSSSGGTIRLTGGGRVRWLRVEWLTGRVSASEPR